MSLPLDAASERLKIEQPAALQEDAASTKVGAKQLRSALERLDEELRRSTRCREAAMAFDSHFKRLGF